MSKLVFIHRPAPRLAVMFAMFLALAVALPGPLLAPERFSNPGGVFGLSIVAALEIGLLSILRRRVDVFDEGDTLRFVSKRWPFAERIETVKRADVVGAEIEYRPRGRSVRLALKLKNGSMVPITKSYFGHSGQTDEDLKSLRALIGA
ncbi:MAG: hypothetical protein U0228_32885 [Myxococcaceae bacterium]